MQFTIDISPEKITQQVKQAVQLNNPIILKTYLFPHSLGRYTEQVLTLFLQEIQQEHIKDYVIFFVNELMFNAKKANTKRIYFIEEGLDITNGEDYRKGMLNYRDKVVANIAYYLKLQQKKEFYFELHISKEKENIVIEVLNNTLIVPMEEERILKMIKAGEENVNLESVLRNGTGNEDGEKAELGIIIMILMMKKMGLDRKYRNISIEKKNGNTIIGIKIPIKGKAGEGHS